MRLRFWRRRRQITLGLPDDFQGNRVFVGLGGTNVQGPPGWTEIKPGLWEKIAGGSDDA